MVPRAAAGRSCLPRRARPRSSAAAPARVERDAADASALASRARAPKVGSAPGEVQAVPPSTIALRLQCQLSGGSSASKLVSRVGAVNQPDHTELEQQTLQT